MAVKITSPPARLLYPVAYSSVVDAEAEGSSGVNAPTRVQIHAPVLGRPHCPVPPLKRRFRRRLSGQGETTLKRAGRPS